MSRNVNDKKAADQVLRVGIAFLGAGLAALLLLQQVTPLLLLGVVFALSGFIAPENSA